MHLVQLRKSFIVSALFKSLKSYGSFQGNVLTGTLCKIQDKLHTPKIQWHGPKGGNKKNLLLSAISSVYSSGDSWENTPVPLINSKYFHFPALIHLHYVRSTAGTWNTVTATPSIKRKKAIRWLKQACAKTGGWWWVIETIQGSLQWQRLGTSHHGATESHVVKT